MAKTKRKAQRSKASAKKTKTEKYDVLQTDRHGLDDSELESHSDFEVHEMFQRVPAHVLQEIQGCLDFVEATKKCRISKFWKLVDNPNLRKGIVLLKFPSDTDYRCRMVLDDKLKSIAQTAQSWTDSMPMLKTARIKHLMTVGPSSSYGVSVSAISPELSKVTYCSEKFEPKYGYACWERLPMSVKSVVLVNCTIDFYKCEFYLDWWKPYWRGDVSLPIKQIRASKAPHPIPKGHSAEWKWTMTIPQLEMDRSLIAFYESEHYDQSVEMALAKALDAHGLIWPYPKEQLQWLLTSLDKLDETVLEVVKDADEKWQAERKEEKWEERWEQHLDQLKITTVASSDGRRLTSLDLAFFGRLLVSLDKVQELANFEPPPFAFPDESHIRLEQ